MSVKYPTNNEIEIARQLFEDSSRVLKANQILWDDKWNSASNPFIAAKQYLSKKERAIRKPIIDSWIAARDAYEAIKPKRSVM